MSMLPLLDPLDKRLNAIRADLADERLRTKVTANGYASAEPGQIVHPVADILKEPDRASALETQMILGEPVDIFDERNRFLWVQSRRDGFVGWVKKEAVGETGNQSTHRVTVARTFIYPEPDMKAPPKMQLSIGSQVPITEKVQTRGTDFLVLADGSAIIEKHLNPIDQVFEDYVSVAEYLTHTPYLWAGTTAFGLDCSGLVQLAMRMSGTDVLRDSDMQAATIGEELEAGPLFGNLERGDLIFWRGHVAICQGLIMGHKYLIHANGHSMTVASEPLEEALDRIEYLYEKPIGFRRP